MRTERDIFSISSAEDELPARMKALETRMAEVETQLRVIPLTFVEVRDLLARRAEDEN